MNQISSDYLSRYLSVPIVQQEILFEQNGASREGLTLDSIKNFWVLVPSFKEQQEILEFISEESEEINQAISHTHREIELMREYRDRLIADVVTGQVDVRGIEVPEDAEEATYDEEDDILESSALMGENTDPEVEE
jgi:type I restriction enzyme S subunit